MSTGAIIGLIIAIVVVVGIAAVVAQELRRARMRRQFGAEYTRLAKELGSNRKAEAELSARQRRASKLAIRPLDAAQRTRYANEWTTAQEQFVDAPAEAIQGARSLVETVLRERGYPADDQNEVIAALSVHHTRRLDDYRHGRDISDQMDTASTEELRKAMLSYRALFNELIGAGRTATGSGTGLRKTLRELTAPQQR
jgi:hypothetical protein